MKTVDFSQYEKKDLEEFARGLYDKFVKKKQELQTTREKLQSARKAVTRLKEAVTYQQRRIIELSGSSLRRR